MVKRVVPDYPANKDELEVIGLKEGDRIVGAAELRTGEEDLVFITDDAQLLRYQAVPGPPAGPPGGRHGGHQARRGREGHLVHRGRPGRRRGGVHGRRLARHAGRLRADARPSSPPSTSTRARAGPPAACAASGSSRARTAWSWPGRAPPRPARRSRTAPRRSCRSHDPRRDGSGTPLTTAVAALAGAALSVRTRSFGWGCDRGTYHLNGDQCFPSWHWRVGRENRADESSIGQD